MSGLLAVALLVEEDLTQRARRPAAAGSHGSPPVLRTNLDADERSQPDGGEHGRPSSRDFSSDSPVHHALRRREAVRRTPSGRLAGGRAKA